MANPPVYELKLMIGDKKPKKSGSSYSISYSYSILQMCISFADDGWIECQRKPFLEMISILIADDHKLIRETWTYILNRDSRFQVIESCSNSEEAVKISGEKHPNVVLMDINMAPFSGIEATRQIREVSPETRIIGVTMHTQPAYAKKMLQFGASGYVTKNSSREEMVNAILEVSKGNKFLCEEIKALISDAEDPSSLLSINTLTEREMDVINLIRQGSSSKDISAKLAISIKTVEVHRHNILKKLKLKNAASLIHFINNSTILI